MKWKKNKEERKKIRVKGWKRPSILLVCTLLRLTLCLGWKCQHPTKMSVYPHLNIRKRRTFKVENWKKFSFLYLACRTFHIQPGRDNSSFYFFFFLSFNIFIPFMMLIPLFFNILQQNHKLKRHRWWYFDSVWGEKIKKNQVKIELCWRQIDFSSPFLFFFIITVIMVAFLYHFRAPR